MNLDKTIRDFLKSYKNKTVSLDELEKLCTGQVSYLDFAQVILELLKEEILTPFKNSKPTIKDPRLHYKYRLHKPLLNLDISQEIQQAQKTYQHINLSTYYHLNDTKWKKDLPYIKQIHDYILQNKTLPTQEVLATELSFQLVGDEKWIDEGNGKIILERLNLWDKLQIQRHPDPLMMSVDTLKLRRITNQIADQVVGQTVEQAADEVVDKTVDEATGQIGIDGLHYHLIVENKSTYYALLEELPSTMFTTLIYGQGWKITANITQLEKQLQGLSGTQQIFYFGDLDYEGIAIWHKLNQIRKVHIAAHFYKILLRQKESHGSKNQRRQEKALKEFLSHFKEEKKIINDLLSKGSYYPQEAIVESELREIFTTYNPI